LVNVIYSEVSGQYSYTIQKVNIRIQYKRSIFVYNTKYEKLIAIVVVANN